MWMYKTHHDGVLIHVWITPIGLVSDGTHAFLGRITEGALVKIQGQASVKIMFENYDIDA